MSETSKITNAEQSEINGSVDPTKIANVMYRQVSLWLSILAIIFGGFIYLTGPGQKNDTALQLQDQRISYQQDVIDNLTKTQQNDVQEIKSEVAGLRAEIQIQTNQLVKLQTILEERLPNK